MQNKKWHFGPVAIGGVGGSGTRVIAKILKELGFYIGNDLNSAYDNLWFTLLFKRPRWFAKNSGEEVLNGIRVFEKVMTEYLDPRHDGFGFIMRATAEIAIFGHDYLHRGRGIWPIRRVIKMIRSNQTDLSAHIGWGWKEPNTHIYIRYLNQYFDNVKYIHVIRHGLDMAYSRNQAQLFNWGDLFGIPIPDSFEFLPKASLNYWVTANETAITLGNRLLVDRFFVVNFDDLCFKTRRGVERLISFLEIDEKRVNMNGLCGLVKTPRSAGRHKKYRLDIFNDDEINAVRKLGFVVNDTS